MRMWLASVLFIVGVGFAQSLYPSFGLAPAAQPAQIAATSAALGDFNGDGKADLISWSRLGSSKFPTNSLTILLGNGDGTFNQGANYPGFPAMGFINLISAFPVV